MPPAIRYVISLRQMPAQQALCDVLRAEMISCRHMVATIFHAMLDCCHDTDVNIDEAAIIAAACGWLRRCLCYVYAAPARAMICCHAASRHDAIDMSPAAYALRYALMIRLQLIAAVSPRCRYARFFACMPRCHAYMPPLWRYALLALPRHVDVSPTPAATPTRPPNAITLLVSYAAVTLLPITLATCYGAERYASITIPACLLHASAHAAPLAALVPRRHTAAACASRVCIYATFVAVSLMLIEKYELYRNRRQDERRDRRHTAAMSAACLPCLLMLRRAASRR